MLDLERPVADRLLLTTVPGAVDYLYEELRHVPEVEITGRRRDGVTVTVTGDLTGLAANRYYSTAAVILGDDPVGRLRESQDSGVLSTLARAPRFRIGAIGEQRWPLRDRLEDLGWANEPGDWDLNIETGPSGLVAEVGQLYWTSRFGELLRAPASTTPVIATVMVRLAKVEPGHTVLDPFCGAGTLLVEALRGSAGRLLGADHDSRWIQATRRNLDLARGRTADTDTAITLWRGDARRLPLRDGSVDRIVSNLPFGKRVGSHRHNVTLYPDVLREYARVLTRSGRAVLLTEDKRLFTQSVQRTRGIRVIKEIEFASGGAHPSAYVVTTRRGR